MNPSCEANLKLFDEFLNYTLEGRPLYDKLLKYIQNKVCDEFFADDIMQEVQMRLIKSKNTYDPSQKFESWLYRVTENQIIDFQRKKRRTSTLSLDTKIDPTNQETSSESLVDLNSLYSSIKSQENPQDICERSDTFALVNNYLKKLPEKSRKILQLVYFSGLTCNEAAKTLEIPVGTLKTRLHSTLERLRKEPSLQELKRAA